MTFWRSRYSACAALSLAMLIAGAMPAAAQDRAPARHNEQIAIVQPQDQATVFDNNGHVDVRVVVSPVLKLRPGDHVELLFDGRRQPPANDGGYALEHVDRGSHQLQARVVDNNGNAIVESTPITFFMWQASRNFHH